MSQTSDRYTVNRDTLTIRVITSDQGQYWCRGLRDGGIVSSQSNTVYLSVKDSPRSTLTVTPDSPVFTGETVTLKCVIETHSDWRYEWYKDSVMLQTSDRYTVNRDTLTIRGVITSDQDQYWCRGQRDERPNSSQESNQIHLSVNDLPKTELTVDPKSPAFTGETVTLKCVIETHSNWRYEWYKDSVMLQTSDRYTVNGDTLTIRGVITSDQGQYWCRGRRDKRPNSSQSRSAVSLSVIERPKAVVKVSPDECVFRGERVTLTCDIQGAGDIQWTYSWFKDGNTHNPYTTTTTAEIRFTADYSAEYSCRGERSDSQRSHISAAVTLTVSDKPTPALTVQPQSSVFTGDRVTLSCDVGQLTGSTILWRKDSHPESTGDETKTIESVSVSDAGEYWCRAQRGNYYSEFSNTVKITVKASSSLLVTAVVVGSSVCLLIFISLMLLWRYKKNKDQQRNINQTSVPNQSAESQPENSPLQSDSDQICDVVTEVKKRDKGDPEPLADVTYSEITVKKNKKKMDKGKSSESGD
uniref:Ig-like domain-containing protein n=1 Tax=Cyprinus carpio TaxID=7962 RepID=A0A8C1JJH1_CYPCA